MIEATIALSLELLIAILGLVAAVGTVVFDGVALVAAALAFLVL